jgi:uncharacterized Tic20 family protein
MIAEPVIPPAAAVADPTQDERNWAMLAHLTALLTVGVAASTGGIGYVVALLVPLVMYLYFAGQSRYVAYHALQATVFQALAGIGYVALAGAVGVIIATAWTITGLLTVVLIGYAASGPGRSCSARSSWWHCPCSGCSTLRGAYLTSQGEPFDYPGSALSCRRACQPA